MACDHSFRPSACVRVVRRCWHRWHVERKVRPSEERVGSSRADTSPTPRVAEVSVTKTGRQNRRGGKDTCMLGILPRPSCPFPATRRLSHLEPPTYLPTYKEMVANYSTSQILEYLRYFHFWVHVPDHHPDPCRPSTTRPVRRLVSHMSLKMHMVRFFAASGRTNSPNLARNFSEFSGFNG